MDNQDIKEILEFDFESQGERIEINEYERNILKDYITTLQEENETLKQDYINVRNYIIMRNVNTEVEDKALLYNLELENINKKRYEDYKSRIDKAIEYIEKSLNNTQPFYKYIFGDENGKVENLDKLLNILQGEKDE